MDDFESQFTQELEDFVNKTEECYPVHTKWSIYIVNAPERHVSNGIAIGYDLPTILQHLHKNDAFYRISILFELELTMEVLESIASSTTIDAEKEQVWLFAFYWYMKYYEHLCDKATFESDFYKQRHMAFLDVLKQMLNYVPTERITFADALAQWKPKTPDQTADAVAGACVSHLPPVAAAGAGATFVKRRLVLKGWGGPAARNKTRRNHDN